MASSTMELPAVRAVIWSPSRIGTPEDGERRERAAEAGHGDLAQQHPEDRHLEQDAVDDALALRRLVIAAEARRSCAEADAADHPPVVADEVRERDDDARRQRQRRAEAREERGEDRDDLPENDRDDDTAIEMTATG